MSESIIEVENLSKLYQLGKIGTGTLSHDLNRWWQKIRGREDEYLTVDNLNQVSRHDMIWSLRDLNFTVQQGEVFGVIGKNGAGKSTLLKILSRITKPSTGVIRINGRVGSLLEVGTGFHPELTGRENVFLNGAILGMKKNEIKRKFDEILNFSGVEKFIDTPVKRYSSGMFVRLAFAVAAHLDPEILIVDEVLAVGDHEFQKKCLGKMKDVSQKDGRTILFVSHSMSIVKQLCNRAILLDHGQQKAVGPVKEILSLYQDEERDSADGQRKKMPKENAGHFTNWHLEMDGLISQFACRTGDTVTFVFGFQAKEKFKACEVRFMIRYEDMLILHAGNLSGQGTRFNIEEGRYEFRFKVTLPVRNSEFDVEAWFHSMNTVVDHWKSTTRLAVLDNFESTLQPGVIDPPVEFSIIETVSEPIIQ